MFGGKDVHFSAAILDSRGASESSTEGTPGTGGEWVGQVVVPGPSTLVCRRVLGGHAGLPAILLDDSSAQVQLQSWTGLIMDPGEYCVGPEWMEPWKRRSWRPAAGQGDCLALIPRPSWDAAVAKLKVPGPPAADGSPGPVRDLTLVEGCRVESVRRVWPKKGRFIQTGLRGLAHQ